MTQFLVAQSGQFQFLAAQDERARARLDQWNDPGRVNARPWEDGLLWPASRMGGGNPIAIQGTDATGAGKFEAMTEEGGGAQMLKIRGTTRDSTNATLPNAVVKIYLTTTSAFLRQLTSDLGGYFEACTEFSGSQHYLTAYAAGSPDVEGTTVNTLTPS